MDDPDTAIGPIEKAYTKAETLVADDAARARRRARVLAAIARSDPAPDVSAARPMRRRSAPPRRGWLIAASVIGASLFVALQLPRQTLAPPPAAAQPPPNAGAPQPLPAAKVVAPPRAGADSIQAPPNEAAPIAPPQPHAFPGRSIAPLVERRSPIEADKAASAGAVAAASPPPPPPAPAAAGYGATSRGGFDSLSSQAGSMRSRQAIRPSAPTPAESLGLAAAGGRTTEVADLLAAGVPVDAPDANGETALMKSIRAGRPKAAALLLRRGANLDLRNHAGLSARDMATSLNDEDLNRVIGETPQP